eukprot:TRINITY_DN132_c0_g1_i2.p1 TRINITY_DN132_c0_g1~~TRINITY_DN132_c0_g1_i2.p1  ORF type:complete len:264 (-),score=51.06 TRINITY_DN132_c0_g1_i2:70-861(-)
MLNFYDHDEPLPASGAPSAATTPQGSDENKYAQLENESRCSAEYPNLFLDVNAKPLGNPKKDLMTTNAKENWRMVLMARNQFTKHGRYGKPKPQKITVNCNTGDVSWNGEYKALNVRNLVGVSFGKEAKPFEREHAIMLEDDVCLILHFVSRDVCLQAATAHQAQSFAEAILACAEFMKLNKRGSSKYHRSRSVSEKPRDTAAGSTIGGTSSSGAGAGAGDRQVSGKGKAVMEELPDRAVSKHMQRLRRANTMGNNDTAETEN